VTPGDQLEVAGDDAGFTAALARLLADAGARNALARRAREWAQAELGWDRVVDRYEELYAELLAR
jgi:glycosyltransferase involved in cell wall biosynthesis